MSVLGVLVSVVSFMGWLSYVVVARIPPLRRNMWPTWLIFDSSVVLALVILAQGMRKNEQIDLLALGTVVSFALFVLVYVVILRVPRAAGRPQAGQQLPAFEVTAEGGKKISADDYAGKAPVLLIFFRGFW